MSKTDPATKGDLQNLHGIFTKDMGSLRREMRAGFDDILQVIDTLVTRFDERFTRLETAFAKQQADIQQILIRLDHIEKSLEISEQERLVMGHQLDRLDKWVHELAGKIGHKLPAE